MKDKAPDAFRTISEVAEALNVPAHVLRFWESRFPQIRPVKRAGGRRYYRPADVALISGIKRLLHDEGLTIRGVQKLLREQGVKQIAGLAEEGAPLPDAFDLLKAKAETPSAKILPLRPRAKAEGAPPAPLPGSDLFSEMEAASWLPARLRALPPGAMAYHQAALIPLALRLQTLRKALKAAGEGRAG